MDRFPDEMVHPTGATMTLVPDVVCIAGRDGPVPGPALLALLDQLGLVVARNQDGPDDRLVDQSRGRLNTGSNRVFVRTRDGSAFPDLRDIPPDLVAPVWWIAPVYEMPGPGGPEQLCPIPHVLIARIADSARTAELLARLRELGLVEDTRRLRGLPQHHFLLVPDPLHQPAFEIRDDLQERFGGALTLHLDYLPVHVPTAMEPHDPLFVDQWNMRRIGAGGPGTTAWDLEQGGPGVVICILDSGCQLDHPDLVGRYASSGINLETMAGTGKPVGNHGTACAGIVAATIGNGVGVAGMAGGCRILPAAFGFWNGWEMADGIQFAIIQGARVISISSGSASIDPDLVDPMIEKAAGAGILICAATHNQDQRDGITYPARHPLVMACGASDLTDNRKRATPGDATGSNYGPQMSVVAPGVQVPSTDRTGAAGYVQGDFVPDFGNTSAATAHVAGLAALLLSADGSLTGSQVRNVIEQTAAKVGAVPYVVGRPNGTWNEEMGYGRIDALAAVQQVIALRDAQVA